MNSNKKKSGLTEISMRESNYRMFFNEVNKLIDIVYRMNYKWSRSLLFSLFV